MSLTGNTPLIAATQSWNLEVVQLLLGHSKININWWGEQTKTQNIIVQWKVQENIVKVQYTALTKAVELWNKEIVQELVKQEDIYLYPKQIEIAFWIAVQNNQIEIVDMLYSGEYINKSFVDICLLHAVRNNQIEVAKKILEYEVDVNYKDQDKNFLLWAAAFRNQEEIVRMLLAKDAIDVNMANDQWESALRFACAIGAWEIVKMLLEKEGIEVNINIQGHTLLTLASQKGHSEIVQLLERHSQSK